MLLSVLNSLFPGAALFWRKRFLQGCWYLCSFIAMVAAAPEIGAMWALYVWIMAQVHFHTAGRARDFEPATKVVIWGTTALMVSMYLVMFGPGWTEGGRILHPLRLFLTANISLLTPALLLTLRRRTRAKQVTVALSAEHGAD